MNITNEHISYAKNFAIKYSKDLGLDPESAKEIKSCSFLALVNCAGKYNKKLNVKETTFITGAIKREIITYLRLMYGSDRRCGKHRAQLNADNIPVFSVDHEEYILASSRTDLDQDQKDKLGTDGLEKKYAIRHALNKAMDCLNPTQKIVVACYYFFDEPMWRIGKVLNVTESMVFNYHQQAIEKLKKRMLRMNIRGISDVILDS